MFWGDRVSQVPFDVTSSIADDSAIVAIAGEVDIYSAPHVHEELQTLIAKGVRHVTVDMSNIEFIDSSGLGLLVTTFKRLQALGGTMFLRAPRPQALQAFKVTG